MVSKNGRFAVVVLFVIVTCFAAVLLSRNVQLARTYGGQEVISTGDGPPLTVWVNTRIRRTGIPGAMGIYRDHPPYTLSIAAFSPSNIYSTLVLTEMKIIYPDGRKKVLVSGQERWSRDFELHTYANSSSSGVYYTDTFRVNSYFESAIDCPSPVKLVLAGYYTTHTGQLVPIQVSHNFIIDRAYGTEPKNW